MGTFNNVVSGLAVVGACVAGYKDLNAGRIGAGLDEFTQGCTSPSGSFQRVTHCSATIGAGVEVLGVGLVKSAIETTREMAPRISRLVSTRSNSGPGGAA